MFTRLRAHFGTAGLVVAIVALIAALAGGAYAASNSSEAGKATASAKAKKGPRGPKGATGPAGPAGPAGPQGAAGAKGKDGAPGTAGANGTNGTNGTNGASVLASTESTGTGNCEGRGGSKFVAGASTTYACNGKEGLSGFTEALPVGKTETGTFALSEAKASGALFAPLSFNIPLATALDAAHVVYVPAFETNPDPTHCAGNQTTPKATSGYLCIYGFVSNVTYAGSFSANVEEESEGTGLTGTILRFTVTAPEVAAQGFGGWAVTG